MRSVQRVPDRVPDHEGKSDSEDKQIQLKIQIKFRQSTGGADLSHFTTNQRPRCSRTKNAPSRPHRGAPNYCQREVLAFCLQILHNKSERELDSSSDLVREIWGWKKSRTNPTQKSRLYQVYTHI